MIVYVFVRVLVGYLSKTKYCHFVVRKQGANDCHCTAFSGLPRTATTKDQSNLRGSY